MEGRGRARLEFPSGNGGLIADLLAREVIAEIVQVVKKLAAAMRDRYGANGLS